MAVAFEEDTPREDAEEGGLVLDLPTFEGPLDLLVELARSRKIDLRSISVLDVADQFLDWLRTAQDRRLELAADWLVLATTLVWLKSKLLIPAPADERAAAEALMEDLAARMRRLDSVRSVVGELMTRRRLGMHWHGPGRSETERGPAKRVDATLHALLLAYVREARHTMAPQQAPVRRPFLLVSVEEAIQILEREGLLRNEWRSLIDVLAMGPVSPDPMHSRSKIASAYVASLEMAKRGLAEVEQIDEGRMVAIRRREAVDAA